MAEDTKQDTDSDCSSVYEEYEDAEYGDINQSEDTSNATDNNGSLKKKGLKSKLKMLYRKSSEETGKNESNHRLSVETKASGIINSLGSKLKDKLMKRSSSSLTNEVDMDDPVCASGDSDCEEMLVYEDLVLPETDVHKYDQLKINNDDNVLNKQNVKEDKTINCVVDVNSSNEVTDVPPLPPPRRQQKQFGINFNVFKKSQKDSRKTAKQSTENKSDTSSSVSASPSLTSLTSISTITEQGGDELTTEDIEEKRYKSLLESDTLYQIYDEAKISSAREKEAIYSDFDDSDEEYHEETESIYEDVSTHGANNSTKVETTDTISNSGTKQQEVSVKKENVLKSLWSETEEVKKSGILGHMSPHERKLQESLFEIITSEATYLKSLNVLINVFMMSEEFRPAKPTSVLTKREHHVIFSNISAIRVSSEKFLSDLEKIWEKSVILYEICEIICNHVASQSFECYVHYCRNQEFQERTLAGLKKKTDFVEALKRLESKPECQKLSLSSFLLLPMQRITRLPLLVGAVSNRMDPEHDKDSLDKAVRAYKAISKIVKTCNESARKIQQTEQMVQIAQNIAFSTTKDITKVPLISSSRYLIKRGDLVRIASTQSSRLSISKTKPSKQTLHVFVFNDIIVLTKKKGTDRYSVVDYGQRNTLHTEILDDPEAIAKVLPFGVPGGCKFLFMLAILENHEKKQVESIFSCNAQSDRERWIDAMTPGKTSDDQKIYEEWDCPQVQCIKKYIAKEPDELTLEEADIVNVFKKLEDGMYEGERVRDGVRGWFPKDHTEEIVNAHVRARNLRMQYKLKTSAAEGDSTC